MSSVPPIDIDDDDEVQVVSAPWEKRVLSTKTYIDAFTIFKERKHNSPKIKKLRDLLAAFKDKPPSEFFIHDSEQSKEYQKILNKINSTSSGSTSARDRKWGQEFVADLLAKILVLRKMELTAREELQRKNKPRESKGKLPLVRAMDALHKIYSPCLELYLVAEQHELNKKHRTPSLKLQQTGKRLQDGTTFDIRLRDKNACPVCLHFSTMALRGANEMANSTNSGRRAEAEEAGESVFEAVASEHGCYCFSQDCHGAADGKGCWKCMELYKGGTSIMNDAAEKGYCAFTECDICGHGGDDLGCVCQVCFEEHNRQKIGLAIEKKKKQEAKRAQIDADGVVTTRPEGTAASKFFTVLDGHFENNMVRELQHNDGRAKVDILQDVASKSAMEMMKDSTFASNTQFQREFRKETGIKKSTTVNWREGKTKSMSYTQALAAKAKAEKPSYATVAGAKAAISGIGAKPKATAAQPTAAPAAKQSFVPPNKAFITNKNTEDYTPPPRPVVAVSSISTISNTPNPSNRKFRNKLSDEPMEFFYNNDYDVAAAEAESLAYWESQYGDGGGKQPSQYGEGGGKQTLDGQTHTIPPKLSARDLRAIRENNALTTVDELKKHNRKKLHIDVDDKDMTTPIKEEQNNAFKRKKMLADLDKRPDAEVQDIISDTICGNEPGLSAGPVTDTTSPGTTLVRLEKVMKHY